ncbi:MAG TPA: PQQ-binding-like beta-propeller repeat protein, partial [Acidimicrobiales bacterium]|nr:PQQ-binding-like beta-propeller repeat protein [Acidimicrobiales bacterium]
PDPAPKGRIQATLAIVGLVAVIVCSALAFTLPNREPAPDGGPAMARYLPLVDGDAALSELIDPDGTTVGWESNNTDVLGDSEALLTLTAATFTQLTTLYGSVADDPSPPGLRHATVRIERVTTMDATGTVTQQRTVVFTRDALGDRLLTLGLPTGEVVFDPPPVFIPSDLHVGKTWHAEGKTGAGQPYTVEGKVLEHTDASGFKDCLRLDITESIADSTSENHTLACSGVGPVERDEIAADGSVTQHTALVSVRTLQVSDRTVPNAAPAAAAPTPEGELSLGRVGKATPTGSITPPTFPATFVPTDPPSILVASERGDLVALAPDTPDVVRWRFHPGGSIYGAPAFDPETGRLYVGATDKKVYALDARGFFLWSIEVNDNVATRPAVSRGIVAFASEGGTAYGIDAATGKQHWKRSLGAAAVASPTVVNDTVVFGSDQGGIHAVDIDDGKPRWSHSAQGSVEGALTSDPDGFVYAADGGGGVSAFAADTGVTRWQVTANDTFRTGPTVVDDLVIVVGDSGTVYAFDVVDGALAWAHSGGFVGPAAATGGHIAIARSNGKVDEVDGTGTLVKEFSAADAVAPTDPAPEFTLGVTEGGGAVWTVDDSAIVRRLGPGSGGLTALQARWVHPFTEAPFKAGFPTTVGEFHGKAVLVDTGGAVYLVDPATGDPQRIGDDPESPSPAGGDAVVDGDQLFMTLGGALRAIDLPSGKLRWTDDGTSFVPNGPVVDADKVFFLRSITNADGSVDADVTAFDRDTGKVIWTRHMTPAGNGPTLAGDLVIVGSPLTALDPADGSIVWQAAQGRDVVGRPGFDSSRDAVIAAVRLINGNTASIDLISVDAKTGAEQWRAPLQGRPEFTEEITVAGDLVLVPELGGPIATFDAGTGASKWEFAPPLPSRHLGIVTVEDGQVWTFSSTAQVFVLDARDGAVLAQSSGLGSDIGSVFGPFGQRIRSVDGVFIAPLGPFVAGFDPPVAPS